MKKLKKVSLTVICFADDAEVIEHEMINSDIAQAGLYTLGTHIENCSKEEIEEVETQVPEEYLN